MSEETEAQERLAAVARGDIVEDEVDENADRGDEVVVDEVEEEVVDEVEEDEEVAESETEEEEETLTVPKARFDEVQRKSREKVTALEERLQTLEKQRYQKTDEGKLEALEKEIEEEQDKYEDLLMEGEVLKARALRKITAVKQRQLNNEIQNAQSQLTSSAAVEQTRFDIKLAQFESVHPEINPDSDDFDNDLAEEVAEVMQAFKSRGYTPSAALHKAVHYVLPAVDGVATKDPNIVRGQRKTAARKKVVSLIKKSPPDLTGKGRDSDKGGERDGLPNVSKMGLEEFDKLTEAQKKEMRGDIAGEG